MQNAGSEEWLSWQVLGTHIVLWLVLLITLDILVSSITQVLALHSSFSLLARWGNKDSAHDCTLATLSWVYQGQTLIAWAVGYWFGFTIGFTVKTSLSIVIINYYKILVCLRKSNKEVNMLQLLYCIRKSQRLEARQWNKMVHYK